MNKMRNGVVLRGKSWTYCISVPDPDRGRSRQVWKGGYRTRKEAEQARVAALSALHRDELVLPHRETVAEYLTRWLDSLDLKPKTVDGYGYNVRKHIAPAVGQIKLQSLRSHHITRLYKDLATEPGHRGRVRSAATWQSVHRTLRAALNEAVRQGLLSTNPVDRSVLPRRASGPATRRAQAYTPDELLRFLAAAGEHRLGPLFVVAAHTGARRGELLFLRWSLVDLESGTLAIAGTRGAVGTLTVEGTTKSGAERAVSLGGTAVDVLRRHRAEQLSARSVAGSDWLGPEDGYVFARADGRPLHVDTPSKLMAKFAAQAGLPRVRFHDLRHTHASVLLANAVPVHEVSGRLGHSTPTVTLSTYAHVLHDRAEAIGTKFEQLLATSD